jgi:hypothetical protein
MPAPRPAGLMVVAALLPEPHGTAVAVAAAVAVAMEAMVAAAPLWPPFKGASGWASSGRHECLRAAAQSARHADVDAAVDIEDEADNEVVQDLARTAPRSV